MLKKIISLSFLVVSAGSAFGTAIQPNQVFSWSGLCIDCAGTATATLTLTSSYIRGQAIVPADFVSFSYDGTNLLPPFTVNNSTLVSVIGNMPVNLANAFFTLQGSNGEFFSAVSNGGGWCAGNACADDYGSVNSFASGTPEPSTVVLLGGALGALALVRRRR